MFFCKWFELFLSGGVGQDAVGSGVVREVLYEAIKIAASDDIVESVDNEDGYVTLKVSTDDIVGEESLDKCFALGVLCTFFLCKTHSAPDPISPVLLQVAIGGFDSIMDAPWLKSVCPPIAAILARLPADGNIPIPADDRELQSALRRNLTSTSVRFFSIFSRW